MKHRQGVMVQSRHRSGERHHRRARRFDASIRLQVVATHVAEAFFGDRRVTVSLSNHAVPGIVLDYDTFEEITDDIDDTRVYGESTSDSTSGPALDKDGGSAAGSTSTT